MHCAKCGRTLRDCDCPDIDERMAALQNNDRYVYKMCEKCGKHWERCNCEEPVWISSHKDFPLERVMATPTLGDIMEMERRRREGKLH